MKEKKHRVEDALSATRAAIEEGIVPGGGVALLNASSVLDSVEAECTGDELVGVRALRRALEAPLRWISDNSGADGSVVIEEVRRQSKSKRNTNWGYNVVSEDYADMVKTGVIDPAKVVTSALSNAASIAALMLTTEVLVTRTDDLEGGEKPKVEGAIR